MDPEELAFAGVARQAELIRGGEVSSRELVELCLARIERLDPELNAFRTVMAERALADAGQADGRRGAGDDRPLLGVPIAVKDTEDVAGETTGMGTAAHGGRAERDNDFVSRLRAAGAVIIGKTNLPELAIIGATEGPAFGVTRNPWNTDRTPGGSSGGSGAAVAAGLCAAATASDGAGSIRIPASCCGIVGLKPQRDRISLAPLDEHWYGMSVVGFQTRTVADTALLLDSTAQQPGRYLEAAGSAPGRLRIALSLKPPAPARVDAQVQDSVRAVADVLRSLGHEVAERDPEYKRASDLRDDPLPQRHRAGRPTRAAPRAPAAAHARLHPHGQGRPAAARLGAPQRGRARRPHQRALRRPRRPAHARRRPPPGARGAVGGHERRPDPARDGCGLPLHRSLEHDRTAGDFGSGPAGARRPPDRRPAHRTARTARPGCSRWPRSWRASCAGPTGGPRSLDG